MDICVYANVNKVIRCEYNNRGQGGVVGGGGCASEIRQTWGGGGTCPKRLKTPGLSPCDG